MPPIRNCKLESPPSPEEGDVKKLTRKEEQALSRAKAKAWYEQMKSAKVANKKDETEEMPAPPSPIINAAAKSAAAPAAAPAAPQHTPATMTTTTTTGLLKKEIRLLRQLENKAKYKAGEHFAKTSSISTSVAHTAKLKTPSLDHPAHATKPLAPTPDAVPLSAAEQEQLQAAPAREQIGGKEAPKLRLLSAVTQLLVFSFFVFIGPFISGIFGNTHAGNFVCYLGSVYLSLLQESPIMTVVFSVVLPAAGFLFLSYLQKRQNEKRENMIANRDRVLIRKEVYKALSATPDDYHSILELRDRILYDPNLMYHADPKAMSRIIRKVWPEVVLDVQGDNRVLKARIGIAQDSWKWGDH